MGLRTAPTIPLSLNINERGKESKRFSPLFIHQQNSIVAALNGQDDGFFSLFVFDGYLLNAFHLIKLSSS